MEEEEYVYDEGEGEYDEGEGAGYADDFSQPILLCSRPVVQSFTPEHVIETILQQARDFGDMLMWQPEAALVLLSKLHWDKSLAQEKFFEDPEGLVKKFHIGNPTAVATIETNKQNEDCLQCWETAIPGDAYSLSCRHWFCRSCWKDHLEYVLRNQPSLCFGKKCPSKGCGCYIGVEAFRALLGTPTLVARYNYLFAAQCVEKNNNFAFCPRPGCEFVVSTFFSPGPDSQKVVCECGHEFCFKCFHEPHAPATCQQLAAWLKKAQDDSETANWVVAHTKPCPKCQINVEKNEGCNHMTCSRCSYEWCWICEGAWSKHGTSWFQCNFFDEKLLSEVAKQRGHARLELERYMHYFKRYHAHRDSLKLSKDVVHRVRERIVAAIHANNENLLEMKYLEDSTEVLFNCRHILSYGYVFAYFMTAGTQKRLFEFRLSDLEHSTEMLSEFVEDTKGKFTRQHVVDATSVAMKKIELFQQKD